MGDVLPLLTGSTLPRIAWDSVLTDATLESLSATESDGAVEQAADWLPWTFWRPTDAGSTTIIATLDGEQTVNGWAIAGHDADGLVGMDTWDGSDWVLHSEVIAAADGAVIYLNGDPISTTKLRFRFTTITFLAVLWAGEDVELPEGIGPGWTDPLLALRADLNPEVTREGIWLGSAVEKWNATLSLDLKNVEVEWARDNWLPFIRQCSTQPFFLHWNKVDFPNSACFCTKLQFGDASFSQKGFVNLNVAFDADPGFDRRITPVEGVEALLTEAAEGPLLLE